VADEIVVDAPNSVKAEVEAPFRETGEEVDEGAASSCAGALSLRVEPSRRMTSTAAAVR
jgi:hypothetical protein